MKGFIHLLLAVLLELTNAHEISESKNIIRESDIPEYLNERAISMAQDPNGLWTQVDSAAYGCEEITQSALIAINDPEEPNLQYIFGSTSEETRTAVASRLQQLNTFCGANEPTPDVLIVAEESLARLQYVGIQLPFQCDIAVNPIWGWSFITENMIIICDLFYQFDLWPQNCWEPSQIGALLHLLLHQPAVTNSGPDDFNDNGYFGDKILDPSLTTEQRLQLPDAFQYYATNVHLECVNGILPQPQSSSSDSFWPNPDDPDTGPCSHGSCGDSTLDYSESDPGDNS